MSPEEIRILLAARDGRMRFGSTGRYVIDGQAAPDRKAREKLMNKGFITWPRRDGVVPITAVGRVELSFVRDSEPSA